MFDWKTYLAENFSKTEESYGETKCTQEERCRMTYEWKPGKEERRAYKQAGIQEYVSGRMVSYWSM